MPPCTSTAGALTGHLWQVSVQSASLRVWGPVAVPHPASGQWPSAEHRVGKQLLQETWDKHAAAEVSQSQNLCPAMSQAVFKMLSGKEATPMPFAPTVVLPEVSLSSVQPLASANPMTWVPLASQASFGASVPQCAERPG